MVFQETLGDKAYGPANGLAEKVHAAMANVPVQRGSSNQRRAAMLKACASFGQDNGDDSAWSVPRKPFRALCKEIIQDLRPDDEFNLRRDGEAVLMLAVDAAMTSIFKDSMEIARHCNRSTLFGADVRLVVCLRNEWGDPSLVSASAGCEHGVATSPARKRKHNEAAVARQGIYFSVCTTKL